MTTQVVAYVRACHTCQLVGKPNQVIHVAPLVSIPAVVDIMGPLPPSSAGNKYFHTIMDVTTRYPEAILIRSKHAKSVVKRLISFFTHFELPKELQSDSGVSFTSHLFKQMLAEWGIAYVLSSAYHPQSQGALERHYQTLKTMLRGVCYDSGKDWDLAVPFVLFAVKEVPFESLGFSLNELVFGHRVRGPLDAVREA